MHQNELVNILSAARADVQRQQQRLAHLLSQAARGRVEVDLGDAAEVERLLADVVGELDEAITRRSLGR